MRYALLLSTAALAIAAFADSAQAERIYRYCLVGTAGATAGGHLSCSYNTLAQCMASKPSHTDYCIVNPRLSYGKVRR